MGARGGFVLHFLPAAKRQVADFLNSPTEHIIPEFVPFADRVAPGNLVAPAGAVENRVEHVSASWLKAQRVNKDLTPEQP